MQVSCKDVLICAPRRTAIGSFGGAFQGVPAPQLGASVISSILSQTGLEGDAIDEVILGSVLTAGQGQAPARQACIGGGLPPKVQAMTINKVCSSGLKACMLADAQVRFGLSEAVIAGGMENMSRAPYLLPALRNGARLGSAVAEDSLIKDGLWDVYNDYHMGMAAELCGRQHCISREQQDSYALRSYDLALEAIGQGFFVDEIVPVKVDVGRKESIVSIDEEPAKLKRDKVTSLNPAFEKDGSVTAANASSISDGAAAMLVCSECFVKEHGLEPVARIVAQGFWGQAPELFTTAPVGAIKDVLKKAHKRIEDVDLFEINEAFSVVTLACSSLLNIAVEKLNVSGGAVALGHPIGASGARILVTLIHALRRLHLKCGVAAICNGGGEATAVLVERL